MAVNAKMLALQRLFEQNEFDAAYKLACAMKAESGPVEGLDFLRARVFLQRGELLSAVQALREELRYFPSHENASWLMEQLESMRVKTVFPDDKELDELYAVIEPYTMVGPLRIKALYTHALEICKSGPLGNFVECGVAAGGTSGLLSAVLLRHDASGLRRLFSFDTFGGMPEPGAEDTHSGSDALQSGWGKGTCAAPKESLLQLLSLLGSTHLAQAVQGLFADTLPLYRAETGPIALLHMDGDWYSSTLDILENLYDNLVPGAYVQVDDYSHWDGCKKAVSEFFAQRGPAPEFFAIDDTGVWFVRK